MIRVPTRLWCTVVLSAFAACGGGEVDGGGGGDGDRPDARDDRPSEPGTPPKAVCDAPSPVDTARADHVVGTGTPESCTAEALAAAVTAGGIIKFSCGAGPTTITVSQTLRVTADTVIDGGGTVTLSGGGTTRILYVASSFEKTTPLLTVQHLTLRDGRAQGAELEGGGGAIAYLGGSVSAFDAVFLDNRGVESGPDVAGGAIWGRGQGTTTVVGSRFVGNRAASGGAIGGLYTGITIVNSTLTSNAATSGNGGAVSMDGENKTLSICGSRFEKNSAGGHGGAVFRTGYHTEPNPIHLSVFTENTTPQRAVGSNEPSSGGALYLQGVRVEMTGSTVSGNRAMTAAGVLVLAHNAVPAVVDLTNVTIANNATYPAADFTKRGVASGLSIGDGTTGRLLNVTIAGNAAQFGAGIWRASPLTIRNSIISNLADNVYTPLNCTGTGYASPSGSGDHNVQWPRGIKDDMDCTPGITRADPMLGALGDNGGATPTMLPAAALPTGTDCPPIDQRGMPRATACTIGAVEVPH